MPRVAAVNDVERHAFKRVLIIVVLGTILFAAGGGTSASPAHLFQQPRGYLVKIAIVAMDPSSIEVPIGARVTFRNNDRNSAHQMVSECPELDAVGRLEPGESGATSPFEESKTCKYHDSLNPNNPLRQGKIVVR